MGAFQRGDLKKLIMMSKNQSFSPSSYGLSFGVFDDILFLKQLYLIHKNSHSKPWDQIIKKS